MKDLKYNIGIEMYNGFSELNQFFLVYKNYIENFTGKSKDQNIEDFISNQMNVLKSMTISHLDKLHLELIKFSKDWEKNKKSEKED